MADTKTRSTQRRFAFASAITLSVAVAGCANQPASSPPPASEPAPAVTVTSPFQRLTVLAIGQDGTLYAGDSGTGKLHSLAVPAAENKMARAPYNLKSVDIKLAALLGTTPQNIRVHDLAIHPMSKEAYLAVARATPQGYASTIAIINQSGAVRLMKIPEGLKTVQVPFAPTKEFMFYGEVPGRDLTFTDIEVYADKVFVAGLSNADFSSSLWTVPASFTGNVQTTTTEIYHAVHDQSETRAPNRSMKVVSIGGIDHLLASYTCTPLVLFSLDELKDGAKVRGKTIGELGYGNTPGDMLAFEAQDLEKNKFPVVFMIHKNLRAEVLSMQAIEKAASAPGLSRPIALGSTSAISGSKVPMTDVLHIDEQDPFHILAIRRDPNQGDLELVSYLKNVYFRLSDFQSEYEIPGYTYSEKQAPIKQFQDMMKKDEGFGETVSQ